MAIPYEIDLAANNGIFYLDGKRFTGPEGHAYLRDECGFSNAEAVQYLCMLSRLKNEDKIFLS